MDPGDYSRPGAVVLLAGIESVACGAAAGRPDHVRGGVRAVAHAVAARGIRR